MPTQIPGRADLYSEIEIPEHMAYSWWEWNHVDANLDEMVFDFTIHNDPGDLSDQYGLYLMVCYGTLSDTPFYFGLQTDVNDPAVWGGRGKGLIFSRWDERDLSYAKSGGGNESWVESSGHEGDFIGVRRDL